MSPPLEIRPHPPAPDGGLAAALWGTPATAGRLFPPVALGPPGGGEPPAARGPARLDAAAFGVSTPEAGERLGRILAGEGTLVTTGQQPLLFLGPLYVLYKALSALELARRLEALSGRPALAVFWIASDDHDWAEVGTTRIIDAANALAEFRLEPPAGWAARPAGAAPLPETIIELVERIFQAIPATEFRDHYLHLFQGAWAPARTVAEAFARGLSGVLAGRPFAWLDAGAPAVKRAAAPLIASSLARVAGEQRALEGGAERIRELGHEAPIRTPEEASNVFYDTGAARERLHRVGDRLRAGREGEERALAAWLEELEAAPERFGPNVALRPVLESWLLPVGATVLGPGELGYWSQLPDLFALHRVGMPAVRPRHGWLLVEGKVRKVLDKLEEEPEALADGGEALARRAIRESRPPEVESALGALRGAIGRGMEEVERAVAEHLPGIRSAVGKARSQAFGAVDELEGRVDARLRERREVAIEQIRKAALHLYPDGRPQERVQSPLYYLARYAEALLDGLEERSAATSPPLWRAR